jgi:hypothetical protein
MYKGMWAVGVERDQRQLDGSVARINLNMTNDGIERATSVIPLGLQCEFSASHVDTLCSFANEPLRLAEKYVKRLAANIPLMHKSFYDANPHLIREMKNAVAGPDARISLEDLISKRSLLTAEINELICGGSYPSRSDIHDSMLPVELQVSPIGGGKVDLSGGGMSPTSQEQSLVVLACLACGEPGSEDTLKKCEVCGQHVHKALDVDSPCGLLKDGVFLCCADCKVED